MATKNLARSILEGGRTVEDRSERRWSNRKLRRDDRAHFRRILADAERAEEMAEPNREARWVSPSSRFTDVLGGIHRWMETMVGKRWDDCYAEIRRRFDVRNLAGWHVVTQHIVGEFARAGTEQTKYSRYVIGDDGIVRKGYEYHPMRREESVIPYRERAALKAEIAAFLADRRIGWRGVYAFWFVPTIGSRTISVERYVRVKTNDPKRPWRTELQMVPYLEVTYRQHVALTVDEVQWWTTALAKFDRYERGEIRDRHMITFVDNIANAA